MRCEKIIGNTIGNDNANLLIGKYGIYANTNNGSIISKNTIFNIIDASIYYASGIYISDCDSMKIEKNIIHGLHYAGTTGYGDYGICCENASWYNTISNNVIYDISGDGYGFTANTDNPYGIRITGGKGYNIYHNSINLYGDFYDGTYSNAMSADLIITSTTVTDCDIRNNSFTNTMTQNPASTATTTVYCVILPKDSILAVSDYNNYFYSSIAPANFVIGYNMATSSPIASLTNLQLSTGQDVNSKEVDPLYTSNTILAQIAGSPLIDAATPIAAVATDILEAPRSLSNPSIGAYEGVPDIIKPTISYSRIKNILFTPNFSLTINDVFINDDNGINTNIGFAPRLYYKKISQANDSAHWKWVTASNGTSPFSFQFDFSLIGGVVVGDGIEYFVVAQDISIDANTTIEAGYPNASLSSVNLLPINFPIIKANYFYVSDSISGVKTVGVNGNFKSLTGDTLGVFNKINSSVITGDLTLKISSNLLESGKNALNNTTYSGGAWKIKIVPDTAIERVISGSAVSSGLISLIDVSNVSIDGSYNSLGRFLNFKNTFTSGSFSKAATIFLGSSAGNGCKNINILNSKISGALSSLPNNYDVFVGDAKFSAGTSLPTDNDTVKIINNILTRAYTGICAASSNLEISGNTIGSDYKDSIIYNVGMLVTESPLAKITKNEIFNIISDSTYQLGIYLFANCHTANIEKNIIRDISNTGATQTQNFGLYIANPIDNMLIANNVIYNINSVSTSMNGGPIGMLINGGINNRIYYNSVNLAGPFETSTTTATSQFSAALFIGTDIAPDNFDIRNNSFTNTKTSTVSTDSYVMVFPSAISFANSNINYNNYYSANSARLAYYDAQFPQTLAEWQIISGQDLNSKTINPRYNSNSILTLIPNSPLLGAGIALGTPSDDILGNTRNTVPTIGAYELAKDLAGPEISFNKPLKVPAIAYKNFDSVYIYDVSTGLNNTNAKPRLYYKKSNQANDSSTWKFANPTGVSPYFNFSMDFSTIGGVAIGDTIQYFFIAQDTVNPTNISYSSGKPSGLVKSTNLISNNFPILGSVDYFIVAKGISGIKKLGSGGDYLTITGDAQGLFKDINNSVLTGDLTVQVISNVTELGTNALTNITRDGGAWKISLVPYEPALKTISGSATTLGLIRFIGIDGFTIDGSYYGGGKYLAFTNTASSITQASTIQISTNSSLGCKNIQILNSIISGGTSASTVTTNYGIFIGNTSLTTGLFSDNDNIKIIGNTIKRAYFGVYAIGSSFANNDSLVIARNIIGDDAATNYIYKYGIDISSSPNAVISANDIYNIKTSNNSESGGAGIIVRNFCDSTFIEKNLIHGIYYTGTGGYGLNGINIKGVSNSIKIYNNAIYDINADGFASITLNNDNPSGIRLDWGSNHRVYNNSIYLSGLMTQTAVSDSANSMCLYITSDSVKGIEIKNNNFINTQQKTGAIGGGSYSIVCYPTDYSFANLNDVINYNNYYATSSNTATSFIGNIGGTNTGAIKYATLQEWQGATGQDNASVSVDPLFKSTTLLMPDTLSPIIGMGQNLSSYLNTDIINNSRSSTNFSIGAYEKIYNLTLADVETLPVLNIRYNFAVCGGNVKSIGGSLVTSRGIIWSLNPAPLYTLSTKILSDKGLGKFYVPVSGLSQTTNYYVRAFAINAGGIAYGLDVPFTTLALLPATLTTTPITNITINSAVSGGNVTSDGGTTVSARGVMWGLSPNVDYYTKVGITSNGSGTGVYTSNITGLAENKTYYLKSFAINAYGYGYGNEISFTTLSSGYQVSGIVKYAQYTPSTISKNMYLNSTKAMPFVTWVKLMQNGVKVDSVKADSLTGVFTFNAVLNGVYTLVFDDMRPWPTSPKPYQLNIQDVSLIRQFIAQVRTFDSLQVKAVNVNMDYKNNLPYCNIQDVLPIRQMNGGIIPLSTQWSLPNWLFGIEVSPCTATSDIPAILKTDMTITVNGAAQSLNIRCIGATDVNGQ